MSNRSIIGVFAALACVCAWTGCASAPKSVVVSVDKNRTTISFSEAGAFQPFFAGHPSITGTLKGVSGRWIIDTGAPGPLLTKAAVRKCGITTLPSRSKGGDMWGKSFPLERATNVTIHFTSAFSVHYDEILVSPDKGPHFGLLDYGTLRAAHAVINCERRTIEVTQ